MIIHQGLNGMLSSELRRVQPPGSVGVSPALSCPGSVPPVSILSGGAPPGSPVQRSSAREVSGSDVAGRALLPTVTGLCPVRVVFPLPVLSVQCSPIPCPVRSLFPSDMAAAAGDNGPEIAAGDCTLVVNPALPFVPYQLVSDD